MNKSTEKDPLTGKVFRIYLIVCGVFFLCCLIAPSIREAKAEKAEKERLQKEQERIERLMNNQSSNYVPYTPAPVRRDPIVTPKTHTSTDTPEEKAKREKAYIEKLKREGAAATYEMGYADGMEAGYDDGDCYAGYGFSDLTEDQKKYYSKAYQEGFKKGYKVGWEEGIEDFYYTHE